MRQHGIRATYLTGCRCEGCRNANRLRQQRTRARLGAQNDRADLPHGTVGGYSNWRCRCAACVAANTTAGAAYKTARRECAS